MNCYHGKWDDHFQSRLLRLYVDVLNYSDGNDDDDLVVVGVVDDNGYYYYCYDDDDDDDDEGDVIVVDVDLDYYDEAGAGCDYYSHLWLEIYDDDYCCCYCCYC